MAKRSTKAAFESLKLCHQVFFPCRRVFFCTTLVHWSNFSRSKVTALLHEYYYNATLILNPLVNSVSLALNICEILAISNYQVFRCAGGLSAAVCSQSSWRIKKRSWFVNIQRDKNSRCCKRIFTIN